MTQPGKDAHPTISDVARRAGVSRATASRALGKYGAINPETLERVEVAAKELGYVANELARAMRAGTTRTIGLIVAEIGLSFFDVAVRAVVDAARARGYQVLLANTNEDLIAEREAVRLMLEKRVDGIILVPSNPLDTRHIASGELRGKPITLLDRSLDGVDAPSITGENRDGARAALAHLRQLGHTKIGLVVTTSNIRGQTGERPSGLVSTIEDRVEGYFQFMTAEKLEVDPRWVRYCGVDEASAHAAVRSVLDSPSPPSALLASNSSMALAVVHIAKERGLVIGRDLSLVGFDDAPWATALTPSLTVVDLPIEEMAKFAVDNLIAQIDWPQSPHKSVALGTDLIIRDSVADLTRAAEHPTRNARE
jgi:LacI family transcriptional regulator